VGVFGCVGGWVSGWCWTVSKSSYFLDEMRCFTCQEMAVVVHKKFRSRSVFVTGALLDSLATLSPRSKLRHSDFFLVALQEKPTSPIVPLLSLSLTPHKLLVSYHVTSVPEPTFCSLKLSYFLVLWVSMSVQNILSTRLLSKN
jgi:hypothetical protein